MDETFNYNDSIERIYQRLFFDAMIILLILTSVLVYLITSNVIKTISDLYIFAICILVLANLLCLGNGFFDLDVRVEHFIMGLCFIVLTHLFYKFVFKKFIYKII